MSDIRVVWEGLEIEGEGEYAQRTTADISWIRKPGATPYYQLSFDEGRFSGYPVMNLTREGLLDMYKKLEAELFPAKAQSHAQLCGEKLYGDRDISIHSCIEHRGHADPRRHRCRCSKEWTTTNRGVRIESGS